VRRRALPGTVDATVKPTAIESAQDDHELVTRLAAGDESAFREVVRLYDAGLRRMARLYVGDAVADDVVQDTWIVVIRGIASFQERSSLKTWVYGILVNVARRRAQREGRTVPFASVGTGDSAWGGTVDLARLHHADLGVGYWPSAPTWARDPAGAALDAEAREVVLRALRGLVPAQREVMTLRDVEGWSGAEVAEVLGISDVNQRTLLHRARVTVRAALEEYFNG
jgi:RNA polymerase sigma-70 factor, ECF subfamily